MQMLCFSPALHCRFLGNLCPPLRRHGVGPLSSTLAPKLLSGFVLGSRAIIFRLLTRRNPHDLDGPRNGIGWAALTLRTAWHLGALSNFGIGSEFDFRPAK
jgi:hypothetical protein